MPLHGSPCEPHRNGSDASSNQETSPLEAGMMPVMAVSAHPAKPLRVLLSEGNSTSARETITILGLSGHLVEVCDPSPYCFARFSRFVAKFHRCPPMRDDPAGFLAFVEKLLATRQFDVLLPIHEQGFLFARVRQRLEGRVGLALPDFADYRTAHSKVGFSRLLDQLGLPQPATRIVKFESEMRDAVRFPCVVKASVGTASRGIWYVRNNADLEPALRELSEQNLSANGAFADEVLVQEFIAGTTEKVQAVFCRGEVIGFHAFRQIAAGAGGGEAIKQSVSRPEIRGFVAVIGRKLAWHGALSLDYVMGDDAAPPRLIDCNPRLVEPMSAYLAGLDLVALLLGVSQGEMPAPANESRAGVRTHLAIQALLGCASRGGTRRDISRECWRLLTGAEPYADSAEELTPLRLDWISAVPLAITAIFLLTAPRRAAALARGGWGAHLLDPGSIRRIASDDFYNG
jgi:predicted ATP-grasp superfamily ATP-dependent carboligase